MTLTIESTDTWTTIDGRPARLWRGTTPEGREVHVFVGMLAVADPAAQAELERDLMLVLPPAEMREVPLKAIPWRRSRPAPPAGE